MGNLYDFSDDRPQTASGEREPYAAYDDGSGGSSNKPFLAVALIGALLMGSLNNGMSLMNVPTFYQDTARGIILLLAVTIDQLSRRRSVGH